MKALCRALLVMNVLYCLLAAAQEGVPGWHMFEAVQPLDHVLLDRDGRAVDVREWLPRGANLVELGELRKVALFVCTKERARAPFTYSESFTGFHATLAPDAGDAKGCVMHAPR